jgi:hypothetical protein
MNNEEKTKGLDTTCKILGVTWSPDGRWMPNTVTDKIVATGMITSK